MWPPAVTLLSGVRSPPRSSGSALFAAVTWEVGLSFAKMSGLLLAAGDARWVGRRPRPRQVLSLSPLAGGMGPHGAEAL